MNQPRRTAVIGAGSWGTALGMQLARNGHDTWMWDRSPERAARMDADRVNERYLPGMPFPPGLRVTNDIDRALDGAELVVTVVPSQTMRSVMADLGDKLLGAQALCCASKGIEVGTLETMDEVLAEVLPAPLHRRICSLSGPSFAKEVAQGLPTAVVVAGHDETVCQLVSAAFHGGFFRVYHTDDVPGVEVGAALKNVIAIACGVADGAGLGTNARAALITRGLREITRLAEARGGQPLTLMGLAGLGQGKTLPQILAELGQVAEGVVTAQSAWQLAAKTGVEMPITEQVYRMLYEDKSVPDALRDLFGRARRSEKS